MPKCTPNVAEARAQAERMLDQAERAIRKLPSRAAGLSGPSEFSTAIKAAAPRTAAHCTLRLESARAALSAVGTGTPLEQRDGYIRAAYAAGQALGCATTAAIGKKLGHMPKAKKPKAKAPVDE